MYAKESPQPGKGISQHLLFTDLTGLTIQEIE